MEYTITKTERMRQIQRLLSGKRLTVSEIACEMEMKKTPYLRNMLKELVNAGKISATVVQTRRNLPTIFYFRD